MKPETILIVGLVAYLLWSANANAQQPQITASPGLVPGVAPGSTAPSATATQQAQQAQLVADKASAATDHWERPITSFTPLDFRFVEPPRYVYQGHVPGVVNVNEGSAVGGRGTGSVGVFDSMM